MNISLEQPEMLLLLIPIILAGFYLLRKTKTKLVEWRVIVAVLLIVALASPVTVVTKVKQDEKPNIILVSDETGSMGLFSEGAGERLYESLTANTPTTLVKLSGDSTSLGDAVLQYAGSGNQIVLVSDGNSNSGKSLEDALDFAKEAGTPVYMVNPDLKSNDLSVELRGDKTLVIGNDNEFSIVVSQAEDKPVSYSYEVTVDDKPFMSGTADQDSRNKSIPVNPLIKFDSLGAHTIRVKITPAGEDYNAVNNEFTKAVYVVPKPKVLLVTNEPNAPLGQILSGLYDVSTTSNLSNLDKEKVLVLDNVNRAELSESDVKKIKSYVSTGGGLVVAGGNDAYDWGDYLNSSFEDLLPVLSKPSDSEGRSYVVLLLDLSGSTFLGGPQSVNVDGRTIYPLYPIMINSIENILKSDELKNSKVGVVAIGDVAGNVPSGMKLIDSATATAFTKKLSDVRPTNIFAKTDLSEGILDSQKMLDKFAPSDASKSIVIITDGVEAENPEKTGYYYTSDLLETMNKVHSTGINFRVVDIKSSLPGDKKGSESLSSFMKEVNGTYQIVSSVSGVNESSEQIPDNKEKTKDKSNISEYELYAYSQNNFITKNIKISGNITGYNAVTPRAGAERVVVTTDGKPVLTTWRYGLGRVAALTTDNGQGEGSLWASELYNGSNAKVISGLSNWAIGNPRAEEGAVLEGPDTWLGTPVKLSLTMYDKGVPKLEMEGKTLDLSMTGKNTYEKTINPDSQGVHDISGYPLAVNYPLEYRDVGVNTAIESQIKATGGKTYTEKDARALLLGDAKENSRREVQESQSLKMPIILAALVLFLGEIIARRIREIQALKRQETVQKAGK